MRTSFRYLLPVAALVLAVTVPPALGDPISLQQILANFGPGCAGANAGGGCPVTFSNGRAGFVYLTPIFYDPALIPIPGQKVTVDLGYTIRPGGSLVECFGATTPGREGKCNDGSSPTNNDVASVLTFPAGKTNIYLFTGNMEENFKTEGGFGAQPSYVQYDTLYSELGIRAPNLGIGTTPVPISTPGVTGYFRMIQGGRNERLFLEEPVPAPSIGTGVPTLLAITVMLLGGKLLELNTKRRSLGS